MAILTQIFDCDANCLRRKYLYRVSSIFEYNNLLLLNHFVFSVNNVSLMKKMRLMLKEREKSSHLGPKHRCLSTAVIKGFVQTLGTPSTQVPSSARVHVRGEVGGGSKCFSYALDELTGNEF